MESTLSILQYDYRYEPMTKDFPEKYRYQT
jgi:hypothetical protein